MAKQRRLPETARKAAPVGAQAQAVLWLKWHCDRSGIEWPAFAVRAEFHTDGPSGIAVLLEDTSNHRVSWASAYTKPKQPPNEVLRVEVPAWAMPTTRADLFHAAMQNGHALSDCLALGMGYYGRTGADMAAGDPEAWDRERADMALDILAQNARYARHDVEDSIMGEASDRDFFEEMREDQRLLEAA